MKRSPGRELAIRRLQSGGLITNYHCTSRCGHCLYYCSPLREKDYIDEETARENLAVIRKLGCSSIHIGGGEPFLNIEGLKRVLRVAGKMGVRVEYVETNSSWYRDRDSACSLLRELKAEGLSTLLVSISPFHNEHIPFSKVKGVVQACLLTGVSAFPWIKDFYREIDSFDDRVTHKLSEYESKFGEGYVGRIPGRYWVHFGGRALKTFEQHLERQELGILLSSNRGGCAELLDVTHFHLDLFGNYIPGLCSGFAIQRGDLGRWLETDEYPILSILLAAGIGGLLEYAAELHGFRPEERYTSKCRLCSDIRTFLVTDRKISSRELQPVGYYRHSTDQNVPD